MKPIFEKATAVAFIGSRPENFTSVIPALASQQQEIKNQLFLTFHDLYRKGFRTFISGMDSIFDLWGAQIVCMMKECLSYRDIRLAAAIPFPGHAKHFTPACLSLYGQLMKQADYLPAMERKYLPGCLLRHNDRILEYCSLMICCFDDRDEKAKYILKKARSRGIPVININELISK